MALRRKKEDPGQEPRRSKRESVEGRGSSQTSLRALGVKTTTVLLFGAIACGPVGLVVGLAAGQSQPAVAEVDVEEPLTIAQQGAGEYAAGFVGSWLRATREDSAPLERYISTSAIGQLSATGWKYRDLTVASIDAGENTDLTSVVVAANVQEVDADSKEQAEIWPRRYYAVTVRASESGLSVIGLPAPVAAPAKSDDPAELAYTQSLPATHRQGRQWRRSSSAPTLSALVTSLAIRAREWTSPRSLRCPT